MSLISSTQTDVFDLSVIGQGFLVYAKHYSWENGKAGFVSSATEKQLIVQYHPGIGNVTNHFIIPASEVANGEWEVRWSLDLSEVFEFEMPTDEPSTEEDTEQGVMEDEA